MCGRHPASSSFKLPSNFLLLQKVSVIKMKGSTSTTEIIHHSSWTVRPNSTTHLYPSYYFFIKSFKALGGHFELNHKSTQKGSTVLTQRCEDWMERRVELEPVKSKEDGTNQWTAIPHPPHPFRWNKNKRRQWKCKVLSSVRGMKN